MGFLRLPKLAGFGQRKTLASGLRYGRAEIPVTKSISAPSNNQHLSAYTNGDCRLSTIVDKMPHMSDRMHKTRKSDRTRAAILDAARRLFAEHGHDGTTVRDIAAAASIDPAMVIRYFGSKDELFVRASAFDLRRSRRFPAAWPGALPIHFEGPAGRPNDERRNRQESWTDAPAPRDRHGFDCSLTVRVGTQFPSGRSNLNAARSSRPSESHAHIADCPTTACETLQLDPPYAIVDWP
jgi:hypothetical protein